MAAGDSKRDKSHAQHRRFAVGSVAFELASPRGTLVSLMADPVGGSNVSTLEPETLRFGCRRSSRGTRTHGLWMPKRPIQRHLRSQEQGVVPATQLANAMRSAGMNPTAQEVSMMSLSDRLFIRWSLAPGVTISTAKAGP